MLDSYRHYEKILVSIVYDQAVYLKKAYLRIMLNITTWFYYSERYHPMSNSV